MAIKNGLNYLEEGGQPQDIMPSNSSPVSAGSTMDIKGVGKVNLKTAIGSDILKNMEDMVAQRSGGFFNPILEGIKDAVAITSRDPGSAMAARDQEKRLEQESIFGMRNQIAALKAAQQQQQARMQGYFGATQPQAGGAAQPQTGGVVQPQAAAAPTGGLLGLVKDPALRQAIAFELTQGDEAKGRAALTNYLAKAAEEPQVKKQVDYLINLGMNPQQALQVALTSIAGSGAFVPHDVRTPGGTSQQTPIGAAGAMVGTGATAPIQGAAPVQRTPAPVQGTPAPAVPVSRGVTPTHKGVDYAVDTGTPIASNVGGTLKYGSDPKGYGDYAYIVDDKGQRVALVGHITGQVLPEGSKVQPGQVFATSGGVKGKQGSGNSTGPHAHIEGNAYIATKTPQKPVESQQPNQQGKIDFGVQTGANIVTGFTPGSKEDLAVKQKMAEAPAEGKSQYSKDVNKNYAVIATKIDSSGQDAGERSTRYGDIVNILEKPGMAKMFGTLERPGVINATIKTIGEGVNVGQFGTLKIAGLERAMANAKATQQEINEAKRVEMHLHKAELEYAKTYLQGQGAVSDNERNLVRSAVGSVTQPAQLIKLQSKIMLERANFDQKTYDLFNAYRNQYGDEANFGQFMRSKPMQDLIRQHNTDLSRILNVDPSKLNNPFNEKAQATGTKGTQDSYNTTPGGIKYRIVPK